MGQAFGTEQGTQISGFQANPNNTSVTRPQGIDARSLVPAAKNIAKSISELAAKEQESNIVTSIANATEKMRQMEAAGKTPAEISRFRDEAATTIMKRFPSADAVNLINSGLRQSQVKTTEVMADGTVRQLNAAGEPMGIVAPQDADLALQASLMNKAINVEADMPNYSDLGSSIARKAAESGIDIAGIMVGNTSVTSRAIGILNEEQSTLQLKISRVGFEQGKVARTRAKNNIIGGIVNGLMELVDDEMLSIMSNTNSTITPGDIQQLGNAYVADWFRILNDEGSFGLLDINPLDFRQQMQNIVASNVQLATAAFSNNNTLLERRKVETQLVRDTNENALFNDLAVNQPNVHRLLVTADGISKAADTVLLVREIEALYPTARPATQALSLDVMTALIGRTPAMEAAAAQGQHIKIADVGTVESFVQWANMQMSDPTPAGLQALKNNFNSRNDFDTMARTMEDAGRGDEWQAWFRQYEGYVKRLEATEQDIGITTEKALQGTREVREEATQGTVSTFFDELLSFTPRRS